MSGGSRERVAAQLHRGRPSVVRLAQEPCPEAEHAGDRRDDAEVDAGPLQHRPLLDVELEVGSDAVEAARLGEPREVEPRVGHRLRDPPPAPVLQVAVAAERPAAEHPRLEAAAFLVVE
jgi:hypothetical protein